MHIKTPSKQLQSIAAKCFGFICISEDGKKSFVSLHRIAKPKSKKKTSQPKQPRETPASFARDENKNPILDANGERIYNGNTTPERRQALESIRSAYKCVGDEISPFDVGLDMDELRWTSNALTFLRLINDPICEQLGEEPEATGSCDFGVTGGKRR